LLNKIEKGCKTRGFAAGSKNKVAAGNTKTFCDPLIQVNGEFETNFRFPVNQYPLKTSCYP
jgi:hypothetical protein